VSLVTAVVDFGSSHTVTVVHAAGRPPRVVTVDGAPLVPSAVFLSRDDQLVVGHDALRMAATDPAHLESRAKARIGEREVLLGDTVLPVTTLVKAVLVKVVRAASALAGDTVGHLVLTHPVSWDQARLGALVAAARGVAPRVSTIAEPVGAGAWFATRGVVGVDGAERLPLGGVLAVLDVGGGTSDVAVVRREPSGIAVIGHDTIADLGGGDLDQRVVDHLRATVPGLAERLVDAAAPGRVSLVQLRELVAFRREVRRGKELLSRHQRVELTLPDGLPAAALTRTELDAVLGPDLDRLTAFTLRTIVRAGVEPAELTAVQLVGGSARIPLLRRLLAEVVPAHIQLDDQPEAAVALGACAVAVSHSEPALAVSEPAPPPEAPPASPAAPPPEPAAPRRSRILVALVAAVAVGAALLAYGFLTPPESIRGGAGATTERFTLGAPERGDALVGAGVAADGMITGTLGVPARMFDGVTDVDWTVSGLLDPATDALVAAGAPEPPPDARWVLVDASIRARATVSAPYYLADTYLLDDRGLLIPPARDVAMPGTCPTVAPPSLADGDVARQCLAFLVSVRTPVEAIAISEVSGGRQSGVLVPVTGGPVVTAPAPRGPTVPLGVVRPLRVGDATVAAAIVDVVTAPGSYVGADVVVRPGSRAVLVRAVARTDRAVSVSDLAAQVLLRDDRYQPVQALAASDRHGCDSGTASGRVVVCAVFAVPVGMPLGSVAWAGDDARPFFWQLP